MITIVGMGENKNDLTLRGAEAISKGGKIIVKTAKTPTYKYFTENNIFTESLDFIYDKATDFSDLDNQIAELIVKVEDQNIVFCVDGNGFDDLSCKRLAEIAEVKIISGVAKGTSALHNNFYDGCIYLSAYRVLDRKINQFDQNILTVIYEIDNEYLATDIKLKLSEHFDEEQEIIYFYNNIAVKIPLYELDMQKKFNYSSKIAILPREFVERNRYSFSDVVEIIRRLRDPDGCKWDKAQTHSSVRSNIIEEAYELVEAIDLDDVDKMIEENGDVLLQAVLQGVIAESYQEFNTNDIINGLCHKLITRHTHIFGENKANNEAEALVFWEKAKAVEKGYNGLADKINSVPITFSALMRADKVKKIAKKSGFDYVRIEDAVNKIYEEIKEFLEATDAEKEIEGGDLLFAVVNVLRMTGVDSEIALLKSVKKFEKRLLFVEKKAKELDKKIEELDNDTMSKFYNEGKKILNNDNN